VGKKDLEIPSEVVIIDFEIILAGHLTASMIYALSVMSCQLCNKMLNDDAVLRKFTRMNNDERT